MERKSSSYEICPRGVIFVVFSAANSTGTLLEFAAVPTRNIEEIVHSVIFCPQPCFFSALRTHFPRRNTRVFISMQLQSINSCLSIKMKTSFVDIVVLVEWSSRFPFIPASRVRIPEAGFFFFLFPLPFFGGEGVGGVITLGN